MTINRPPPPDNDTNCTNSIQRLIRGRPSDPGTVELINFEGLTDDRDDEALEKYAIQCPYIKVKLNSISFEMLVDTGAEITVIANQNLKRLTNENDKIPTLPVVGL